MVVVCSKNKRTPYYSQSVFSFCLLSCWWEQLSDRSRLLDGRHLAQLVSAIRENRMSCGAKWKRDLCFCCVALNVRRKKDRNHSMDILLCLLSILYLISTFEWWALHCFKWNTRNWWHLFIFQDETDEDDFSSCGNYVIEGEEECDCGLSYLHCNDPCCYAAQIDPNDLASNHSATPCKTNNKRICQHPYESIW